MASKPSLLVMLFFPLGLLAAEIREIRAILTDPSQTYRYVLVREAKARSRGVLKNPLLLVERYLRETGKRDLRFGKKGRVEIVPSWPTATLGFDFHRNPVVLFDQKSWWWNPYLQMHRILPNGKQEVLTSQGLEVVHVQGFKEEPLTAREIFFSQEDQMHLYFSDAAYRFRISGNRFLREEGSPPLPWLSRMRRSYLIGTIRTKAEPYFIYGAGPPPQGFQWLDLSIARFEPGTSDPLVLVDQVQISETGKGFVVGFGGEAGSHPTSRYTFQEHRYEIGFPFSQIYSWWRVDLAPDGTVLKINNSSTNVSILRNGTFEQEPLAPDVVLANLSMTAGEHGPITFSGHTPSEELSDPLSLGRTHPLWPQDSRECVQTLKSFGHTVHFEVGNVARGGT